MTTARFLIGLPGCGKSFFRTNFLSNYGEQVVYSTDDEIENIASHRGLTYDDAWSQFYKDAETIADDKLSVAIAERRLIIWDQTNLTSKTRKAKIARLPANYMKIAHVLLPPSDYTDLATYNNRLKNRPGKTIPYHVVLSMMKTFETPMLDEGFDYIHFWNSFDTDSCGGVRSVFDIQDIFKSFRFIYDHVRNATE